MFEHLPGGDILIDGLRDLAAGIVSVPGLLLLAAEPRLRRNGIQFPENVVRPAIPEHDLYHLLVREHGSEAYRHYRALLRRLASLENALDVLSPAAATNTYEPPSRS
jgi:hypothetical protein